MQHIRRITILTAVLTLFAVQVAQSAEYAVGVVYHDANKNSVRDRGEEGIPGVMVSNGREIVRTDKSGAYRLPVDGWTIIFVTKPRGWMTPVCENNLPLFYYVHKPAGSPKLKYRGVDPTGPLPESVDFPLYRQDEPDKFKVVLLGDTQPYNMSEVFYLRQDLIPELVGVDAAFGMTLGDVAGNDLSLYEPVAESVGRIGVPWFHVKGNHDTNYDAIPDHDLSSATWVRVFGPTYYSFDYGPVHFVVLNNNYYGQPGDVRARLDARQMSWLRRDLAMTHEDQLVVLTMHIPIYDMEDAARIYRLIENRPNTLSVSAHRHVFDQRFLTAKDGWNGKTPHHHIVAGTACGAWYRGLPDEVGIPHGLMRDGTPKGYMLMTFDGSTYSARYKATRRPDDYQMNIYAPDEVESAAAHETDVLVNVFADSPRSTVEMRLGSGGDWIAMERVVMDDPNYVRQVEMEAKLRPMTWKLMREPRSEMSHLWRAKLPANPAVGTGLIHVRTTDMYGQTYTSMRVISIR